MTFMTCRFLSLDWDIWLSMFTEELLAFMTLSSLSFRMRHLRGRVNLEDESASKTRNEKIIKTPIHSRLKETTDSAGISKRLGAKAVVCRIADGQIVRLPISNK